MELPEDDRRDGDLGVSIAHARRTVTSEIKQRFPATVELRVGAMIFAVGFGIPLGFFAAKRYGGAVRPREPGRRR